MIGIITCSRKKDNSIEMFDSFNRTLMVDCRLFEMVGFDNIAEGYNAGMKLALKNKAIQYLIFTHSDVLNMASMHAFERMLNFLDKDGNTGFCGVAGALRLNSSGVWWQNSPHNLYGSIMHEDKGNLYQSKFGVGLFEKQVLVLDGVFLCASRSSLEGVAAEQPIVWRSSGFHFYDIDACLQMHTRGYKNYTVAIPLIHKSIGVVGEDFEKARQEFVKRWQLPISIEGAL